MLWDFAELWLALFALTALSIALDAWFWIRRHT